MENEIFIYIVDGREFYGTECWGENWQSAKALAKELHTYIKRTRVQGNKVIYETYLKVGMFLEDFRTEPKDYMIF